MGMKIGTGWREREAAGKAALAARDAGYNIALTDKEQARHAMYAAKAEADRLAQEAAEALILSTVSVCPCCAGKGHVAVPDAAKVVEAVRRYDLVGWRPDALTISDLMRSAITVDKDGNRVAEIATVPGTDADLAAVSAAVRESVTATADRIAPVMNTIDDAPGSDAEALAAVEAETAKSAKAARRRVAPLPFMDQD